MTTFIRTLLSLYKYLQRGSFEYWREAKSLTALDTIMAESQLHLLQVLEQLVDRFESELDGGAAAVLARSHTQARPWEGGRGRAAQVGDGSHSCSIPLLSLLRKRCYCGWMRMEPGQRLLSHLAIETIPSLLL